MPVPPSVPEPLIRATIEWRGDAGAEWLKGIPAFVADLQRRWSPRNGPPFLGSLSPLGRPGAICQVFDGRGIQEFLRVDLEAGTSLLPDLLVCGQCGRRMSFQTVPFSTMSPHNLELFHRCRTYLPCA